MAEVAKRRGGGSSSEAEEGDDPVGGAPVLSEPERQALVERERARMADPGYSGTLEDPSGVIDALLRHHGRR